MVWGHIIRMKLRLYRITWYGLKKSIPESRHILHHEQLTSDWFMEIAPCTNIFFKFLVYFLLLFCFHVTCIIKSYRLVLGSYSRQSAWADNCVYRRNQSFVLSTVSYLLYYIVFYIFILYFCYLLYLIFSIYHEPKHLSRHSLYGSNKL